MSERLNMLEDAALEMGTRVDRLEAMLHEVLKLMGHPSHQD